MKKSTSNVLVALVACVQIMQLQMTLASHRDDPIEPIVCTVPGIYVPGCNMNAGALFPYVLHDPLTEEEKECVQVTSEEDGSTSIQCPVDLEAFLYNFRFDDYFLDGSITCPAEAVEEFGDFYTANRNEGLCECLIDAYFLQTQAGDVPIQVPGQGPEGFYPVDCECHTCPPGSISPFAISCQVQVLWECYSVDCDGHCGLTNTGGTDLDWLPTEPTEAPSTVPGLDNTVDCVQEADDGTCIANGLSDPVLVFSSFRAKDRACFIGEFETIEEDVDCPVDFEIALLGNEDQVYNLSADITCSISFSTSYGFDVGTRVKNGCDSSTTLVDPDGTTTTHECVWHTCPDDYFSPVAVECETELIGPCKGFSCNGVCNGKLEYLPDPRNNRQDMLFEDPLSDTEKEKVAVGDIVQWSEDMVVTTINEGEDLTYYLDSRMACDKALADRLVDDEDDWFDFTRYHGRCECTVDVYEQSMMPPDNQPGEGPLPDGSTTGRRLQNCQCHTCQTSRRDYETNFALQCDEDIIVQGSQAGCKSINCRGECNEGAFFFPSPSPTIEPTLSPSETREDTPTTAPTPETDPTPSPMPTDPSEPSEETTNPPVAPTPSGTPTDGAGASKADFIGVGSFLMLCASMLL